MKAIALTTNEQAASGHTTLLIFAKSDLTQATANTAQAITGITLRPGDVVGKLDVKLVTPFANSGDNAHNTTTLTVGDSGSANRFLTSTELNANGTPVRFATGTGTRKAFNAADTLLFTFGSQSGKNLAALTQGEVHVYLHIYNLNDWLPNIA